MDHGRNRAELLVNGDQILPALLSDLRAAERSIHVSMYLWFHDPVGDEVAAILSEKARDGVAVRVLLNVEKTGMDDPFSTGERKMIAHDPTAKYDPLDVKALCRGMRDAGVQVADTNIDYDRIIPSLDPRLASIATRIRKAIEIDDLHVDHRKLVAIDGRVGYCGGANIGVQYMYHVPFDHATEASQEARERAAAGLPEPWWKWHDSLTRFEGPIVTELERHFRDRFILDGGADYPLPVFHPARSGRGFPIARARTFANEPNDEPNAVRELYVRLIGGAKRSIFIENPYFYHPALVGALCEAKRKNPALDVTLMLTSLLWNDNGYSHDAQQHEYARYLEHGIAVYEYQNHFNHLKMAVFDERWSIHGSTNGNFRSLDDDKDFELIVLVDDEPFARDILARVRDVDVPRARRITPADLRCSLAALRIRYRDPRTLFLISRREL